MGITFNEKDWKLYISFVCHLIIESIMEELQNILGRVNVILREDKIKKDESLRRGRDGRKGVWHLCAPEGTDTAALRSSHVKELCLNLTLRNEDF